MESSTSLAQPMPQFTITTQNHQAYFDANGNQQSRWDVHFQTPSGIDSFVTVADQDYTPDNVARMIAERVRTIEQVQSLGSGTTPQATQ